MRRAGFFLISTALHLLAGGVIYYFWRPIVAWYWNYRPILGVDFYNTVSYVSLLARDFAFRFNGWRSNWYGGYPMEFDYPSLHFYLNLPFLSIFSLPQAVQAYVLITCFLFLFFSYLLFAEIGRDRVLAVVLTIASSFSIAIYGSLVWGGSLPYFSTQFLLPIILWSLMKFFNTSNKRWYFLSSLFLGISFLGHPQVGFSYAIPISFLLLLFYPFPKERFFSGARFKRLFLYFLIAVIIGCPQLVIFIGYTPLEILSIIPKRLIFFLGKFFPEGGEALPGVVSGTPPETIAKIAEFQKGQLERLITETNPIFFVFLAAGVLILFLSFIFKKRKRESVKVLVFALPALWVAFYASLYAYGISFFHGGWYRIFWPFPLCLGILISFIWGDFWASIKERFGSLGQKPIFSLIIPIVSGIIILVPGLVLVSQNSAQKMIEKIDTTSFRQQSGAFPDSLGVYIEREGFEKLKGRLTPSWLDPNDTQYRFYEPDQRVNIWWNALYDMPLVKGYVDPPAGDTSGGFYWLDIALTQSAGIDHLVETWGTPKGMAYNNALFLIDWFSAKYIEAEHEKSDSYSPPTSYLAESDIFENKEKIIVPGWAELYHGGEEGSGIGPIVWHPEEEEYLTYYKVKDDLVSPIAHTTGASTIGVIGAIDAYRTILRDLAAVNLNSRMVIPLQLGQLIEDVSEEQLKDMDAVILYAYDYRNHGKSWAKLEKYVKAGGKVFIETGSEVKQTGSINLPARFPKELPTIFPIKMTKQEEMGTSWQLSGEFKETEGINLEAFGPPILDNKPWLFSLPNSEQDLKERARVILTNNGVPLVVSWQYGQGEVIWSGMNLPYHITVHKNLGEANFFKNLLEDFIFTESVDYSGYKVERESASKMIVTGSKSRGVFFREQHFPGWQAKIVSDRINKGLEIYHAGPTYPGFMYVVVPLEAREGEFKITFSYGGNLWAYFWQIISLVTILTLLDRILLNGRVLVPIFGKVWAPLQGRVGKWWEKEEEY